MKTYIYVLKLCERLFNNDAWTDYDNQSVNEHYLRLKKDFESGKVLHVGRTSDPTFDGFGIVVYLATNNEEAITYMNNDPAVINGQMTAKYYEYNLVMQK
jgi:uncharacterized protein YciI